MYIKKVTLDTQYILSSISSLPSFYLLITSISRFSRPFCFSILDIQKLARSREILERTSLWVSIAEQCVTVSKSATHPSEAREILRARRTWITLLSVWTQLDSSCRWRPWSCVSLHLPCVDVIFIHCRLRLFTFYPCSCPSRSILLIVFRCSFAAGRISSQKCSLDSPVVLFIQSHTHTNFIKKL